VALTGNAPKNSSKAQVPVEIVGAEPELPPEVADEASASLSNMVYQELRDRIIDAPAAARTRPRRRARCVPYLALSRIPFAGQTTVEPQDGGRHGRRAIRSGS
jgi:hypothetical protein